MVHELITSLARALVSMLRSRAALLAENALLRQQLIVLRRAAPHPRLKARDRLAIAWASRVVPALLDAVTIVRPETVLRWHRSLCKLLWRRRSPPPLGRPPADADTRALIRRMWKENPLWGEDLIAGELAKLGHDVSPRTVAKYRPARLPRGRGQKWSTFIRNHIDQTCAADWFTGADGSRARVVWRRPAWSSDGVSAANGGCRPQTPADSRGRTEFLRPTAGHHVPARGRGSLIRDLS